MIAGRRDKKLASLRVLGAAMAEQFSDVVAHETPAARGRASRLPFGSLAFAGAIVSMVACYGSIAMEAFFGVPRFGINAHIQAVVMWGFGLLAVLAIWRDRKSHRRLAPLLVAGAGAAVLIFTLYVHYDSRIEVLAYILLVVGALLNQNAMVVALYREVRRQATKIGEFNRTLEEQVRRQVDEIERLGRLKRFLAPPVAELVIAEGGEDRLNSHRRYIACLFCDIRNFTALSEGAEPEETISLLQVFHRRIGDRVAQRRGTIGYRAGDGLMAFFNDPYPCDEPVLDAVRLALDIREIAPELQALGRRYGRSVGIGVGIASGFATLGLVGEEGGADYTAVGNVVNVASRLCDQAQDGEVLIDRRAFLDVENRISATLSGTHAIKGMNDPVTIYRLDGLPEPAQATRPGA